MLALLYFINYSWLLKEQVELSRTQKKNKPPEVFSLYTTTPVKSGVESQLYINALHHNASINKNGERYQIAVV